ncbi:MAG: hypothetical protein ACJATI_003338, partial [Halioglobus sp.]
MNTSNIYTKSLSIIFTICFLFSLNAASSQSDYYWIGGSGDWTDLTHWATTSGGATSPIIVPSPLDRVIFDANSGLDGGTVVMNFEAFCDKFEVPASFAGGITFDFNAGVNIFDYLTIADNVTWQQVDKIRVGAGGLTFGENVDFNAGNINTTIDSSGWTIGKNSSWTQTAGSFTVTSGDFVMGDNASFLLNNADLNVLDGDMTVGREVNWQMNPGDNGIDNGDLILSNGALFVGNASNFDHSGDVVTFSIADSVILGDTVTFKQNRGHKTIGKGLKTGSDCTITFQTFNGRNAAINSGGLTLGPRSSYTDNGNYHGIMTIDGDITLESEALFYIWRVHFRVDNGDILLAKNSVFNNNTNWSSNQTWVNHGTVIYQDTSLFRVAQGDVRFGVGDVDIPRGSTFDMQGNAKYIFDGSFIARENSNVTMNRAWILVHDGSIIYEDNVNYIGGAYYRVQSNTASQSFDIRTGGHDFRLLELTGSTNGSTYTLQDDFTAVAGSADWGIYSYVNNFVSNGKNIHVNRFYSNNGTVRSLDFTGTDTIKINKTWETNSSTNTTLNIGTAVIAFESTNTHTFTGGNGKIYNDVVIHSENTGTTNTTLHNNFTANDIKIIAEGYQNITSNGSINVQDFTVDYTRTNATTNIPVVQLNAGTYNDFDLNSTTAIRPIFRTTGSNTFNSVDLGDATDLSYIRQWELGSGTIQTTGSLVGLTGTCPRSILINSTNLGSAANISVASGTIIGDFLRIQDNNAIGGATFDAANTLDFGNVSGWNFTAVTPSDFYWIGNSSTWDDPNAWAFSSGGTPAGCVPTRVDNVFFDDNSFSASGQNCNISVPAECHDMTWNLTTVSNSGLTGNQPLSIYGSLKYDADMAFSFTGDHFFQSFDGGETIETAGKTLRNMHLEAQGQSGGEWSLVDSLTASGVFELFGDFYTYTSLPANSVSDFTVGTTIIDGRFYANGEDLQFNGNFNMNGVDTLLNPGGDFTVTGQFWMNSNSFLDQDGGEVYVGSNAYILGNSRFDSEGGNIRFRRLEMQTNSVFTLDNGDLLVQGDVMYIRSGSLVDFEGTDATLTVTSNWLLLTGTNTKLIAGGGLMNLRDFYFRTNSEFISNGSEIIMDRFRNDQGNATINLLGTDLVQIRVDRLQVRSDANLILDTDSTGLAGVKTDFEINYNSNTNFWPGGQSFNTVTFNYNSTSNRSYRIIEAITADSIVVNANGRLYIDFENVSNVNTFIANYTGSNSNVSEIDLHTNGSVFGSVQIAGSPNNQPYFRSVGSITYDSISLSNVEEWQLWPSKTHTINNLKITGACTDYTKVRGVTTGQASDMTINGSTDVQGALFIDIDATSSTSSPTASASIDGGNVSGWSITGGVDLFWVGDTGNWDDANHWSFSSGGAPSGCLPSRGDNVFFDVNSFSAPGQTVNFNVIAEANNVVWNNVNFPSTIGNQRLDVYGSLLLDANMTWNSSGYIYLQSRNTGNTVTTNGVQIRGLTVEGSQVYTGEWTLQGDLNVLDDIYLQYGSFVSNGYDVSARSLFNNINNSGTSIDFTGTNSINIKHRYEVQPNANINMGTADITFDNLCCSYYSLIGGNHTYNDITFNHNTGNNSIDLTGNNTVNNLTVNSNGNPTLNVDGNSTYNDITFLFDNPSTNVPVVNFNGQNTANVLSITSTGNAGPQIYMDQNNIFEDLVAAGVGTRILLGVGSTQTVNGLLSLGTGSFPVFFKTQSDDVGQTATIYKPSGQVCLDFVLLQNIIADGDPDGVGGIQTDYFAGASSVDLLGNSANWNFASCGAYYWVGDSGDWSDFAGHWATSSGGTAFHGGIPGPGDDVFFDANSFTAAGQVVNVDVANAQTKNMSWQSALFTPTISGTSPNTIDVYGDLDLITTMNQNFTGSWNFYAADNGHTVNTAGHSVSDMNFLGGNDGEGEWTLVNGLDVSNNLNFQNGTLITDDKDINTKNFNVTSAMTQSLQLGASTMTIDNGTWNPQELDDTELVEGSSEIIISGSGGISTFLGNDLTYNDVTFSTSSSLNGIMSGSNTMNTLTISQGLTLTVDAGSTQTMNSLEADGTCDDLIIIESSTPGTPSTFAQSSGTNDVTFVNIQDNTATGGATFNANSAVDNGGNTGWNFLSAPAVLVPTIVTTDVDCDSNNDGTAEVTSVANGTAPYMYQWSTTATTALIENLIPGSYSVTVTDATGCFSVEAVALVNAPSFITPTAFTLSDTAICQGTSIDFTAGNPPEDVDTYLWNFGDFNTSTTQNPTHTYAANGVYTVTLSYIDYTGCPAVVSDVVTVSDLDATVSSTNIQCFGEANGSLDIIATNGIEPYQYSIDNGANYGLSSSFTGLTPSTYNIKVIDANLCETATISVNITQPSSAANQTVTQVNTTCSANEDGEIHVTGAAGTPPYQYSINNGIAYLTSGDFIELLFGTYNVITRDANLCITSTQVINIIVEDNVLPTITCPADVNATATGGACDVAVTVGAASTNDNCGVASVTNSYNGTTDASDTYPTGTTIVTWYVIDINGNIDSCAMNVVVTENTDPTITCANDTTVVNIPGTCGASIVLNAPVAADNCDLASVTNNAPVIFPVGNTIVEWTATDAAGNTAVCQQNVMVSDNEDPTITCPANITVGTDSGTCSTTSVNLGTPTTSDNCPGESASNDAPTSYPLGNTSVIWTVIDASGLTETCTQIVTVEDNEDPMITCPADITTNTTAGICQTNVDLIHATGSDNCGVTITSDATVNGVRYIRLTQNLPGLPLNLAEFEAFQSGINIALGATVTQSTDLGYPLTNFTDGNLTNFMHTIAAVGEWAEIDLGSEQNIEYIRVHNRSDCCQNRGESLTLEYKDASNNVIESNNDFNVYEGVNGPHFVDDGSNVYQLGTTNITWTATDDAGNTASCVQTITVEDNEDPTITCPADLTLNTDPGECFATLIYTEPVGTDNCPGAVTTLTSGWGSGGTPPIGTDNVTYLVTDAAGNTAECTFTVTVIDNEAPVADCVDFTIDMNAGLSVSITANDIHGTSTDNCDTNLDVAIIAGQTTYDCDDIGNSYNVTLQVTDDAGLTGICTASVTVTDTNSECNAPPVAVCTNITVDANASCEGIAVAQDFDGGSSDPDVGDVLTFSVDIVGPYALGTTDVVLTVTDQDGLFSTCDASITVEDNVDPSIVCAADQTQTADAGDCDADVTVVAPSTGDNCGVASITNDYNGSADATDNYPVGTTTVVWTVTDIHLNTNTCSQVITVTDNEAPSIACAPDQTQTADAGDCDADVTVVAPSTGDNCGVASITNDYNGSADATDNYPVGTTTVVWTVTDIHLNTNTCSQDIAVTDNEDPSIACAADQTQTADAGDCDADVTVVAPITGDNCGVDSITNDYNTSADASDNYPVGTTTVVWTVTDIHLNTNTCSQVITVTDNEAPSIACAPDQTQTADAGDCDADVTVVAPSTGDNCGVASITNDYNGSADATDNYPVGTTTVVWTVTDIHLNTNTCSQDIAVTDNEDPSIACAADQTQTADAGDCDADVTVVAPITGDNCGVDSIT